MSDTLGVESVPPSGAPLMSRCPELLVTRSLLLAILVVAACGGEAPAPTVAPSPAPVAPGPVVIGPDGPSDIPVPACEVSTDPAGLARGEQVIGAKGCGACHQFGTKLVGPDLLGVAQRRTTMWIARQIHSPEKMTKEDPVARQLFKDIMVQMTNQGVADNELGPLISYLASKNP